MGIDVIGSRVTLAWWEMATASYGGVRSLSDGAAVHGDGDWGTSRTGLAAVPVGRRIFLLGGDSGRSASRVVESFEPASQNDERGEWRQLPPMRARRAHLAAAALRDKIFAIGGGADGRILNTVEAFRIGGAAWDDWDSLPPTLVRRTFHSAWAANDLIFVCGGFDGTRDLASCEVYDPKTNWWKLVDNMTSARSCFALVQMGGHLYAIGGQDRLQRNAPRAHSSVERFDLFAELWSPVQDLSCGRIGPAAGLLLDSDGEEYLYVCGGIDQDGEVTASVERLGALSEAWFPMPPMNQPRWGHTAAVVENKLYVIGGSDSRGTVDTFECFDPEVGHWGPTLTLGALPDEVARQAVEDVAEDIAQVGSRFGTPQKSTDILATQSPPLSPATSPQKAFDDGGARRQSAVGFAT